MLVEPPATKISTVAFAEYIERVRREAQGDGYFQLFAAKLREKHVVQRVTVSPLEEDMVWYRFFLARLGAVEVVIVPAGGDAIERYVRRESLKMETLADEKRRSFVCLRRAVGSLMVATSSDVALAGLRGFAERVTSPEALVLARQSIPQVLATGLPVELLVRSLQRAFDDEVLRLAVELEYDWDVAGQIADQGLRALIASST